MSLKEKAVLLLSGGLDSTVTLAEGAQQYEVILALTFNYGQRAWGKEIRSSRVIAESYGVRHEVVPLPWFSGLLPKPLKIPQSGLDPLIPEEWQSEDPADKAMFFEAQPVWVPNRNGLFINIAATYAEALGATVILFGANAEEAERFPDNSEAFRQRINDSLAYSTLNHTRVECPLGSLNKAQIIDRAHELNVPLHLIWSCYTNTDYQCGFCPSCTRLRKALDQAKAGQTYRHKIAFIR